MAKTDGEMAMTGRLGGWEEGRVHEMNELEVKRAVSQSQGSLLGRMGLPRSDPTKARRDTFPATRGHTTG